MESNPESESSHPIPFPGHLARPFSDERLAILLPKLRAILDDFEKLEELETHESEPMIVLRRWKIDSHDS